MTLLEGREACEFKLKAPLKFWSGRADCESEDKDGRGYKAAKEENQPRLLGDAMYVALLSTKIHHYVLLLFYLVAMQQTIF